jgi:hypothetical protein
VNVAGVSAWSNATTYGPGDLVTNGGTTYWAIIGSLNQAPPNATYWYPLPGALLEIPTPFTGTDLPNWSQSGRTITLTHEAHPPQELTYQALTHWSLIPVVTVPAITPPTGVTLTLGAAGIPIIANTVANPTVVQTGVAHGLTTGQSVVIAGNTGSTPSINGTLVATVVDPTHFSVPVNVTVGGTGGTATPTTPIAGGLTYAYVVTTAAFDSYEESNPSGVVINAGCTAPTQAAPHIIKWTAVVGAAEYYVYCDPYANGTFGLVGKATGAAAAQFNYSGTPPPNFTQTPPIPRSLFASTTNYPKASATYQQRRFFGYSITTPDRIDGSQTGFPSNFGISSPIQDDDALTFRLAASQHNPVRHLVGLKSLIVLTDGGEWLVGAPNVPLTPSSINANQETFAGCSLVRPVAVGNSILYVQARGAILRDVRFDFQVEGLAGRDLTIYSSHLVDGHTLTHLTYAQTPESIVWMVRDDGVLLGCTYVREQDAWGRGVDMVAWHRHDTNGFFWDVCALPELTGDTVYLIVRRTIGGLTVRYLEKLERRTILTFNTDAFFVDAGLTYNGAPVTNVTGLDHLNGQVVAVLADGVVVNDGDPAGANAANFTVAGGTLPVALAVAASVIHAGLPIRFADFETLDLDVGASGVRDKQKRVSAINLLIDTSIPTFLAGPDATQLIPYAPPPYSPTTAGVAQTGQIEINLTSSFNKYGRVFIRHTDPLPLAILAAIPQVNLGG